MDNDNSKEVKFCSNCGQKINLGTNFCSVCGTPVVNSKFYESKNPMVSTQRNDSEYLKDEIIKSNSYKKKAIIGAIISFICGIIAITWLGIYAPTFKIIGYISIGTSFLDIFLFIYHQNNQDKMQYELDKIEEHNR